MHDDSDPERGIAKGGTGRNAPLLAQLSSVWPGTFGHRRIMHALSSSSDVPRLVLHARAQFGRLMMRSQGLDPRASSHACGVPPAG